MSALRKAKDVFVRQELIQLHGKQTTAYYDKLGEVWFLAKEQCEKLGLSNVTRALNSIPERGKIVLMSIVTSSKDAPSKKQQVSQTLFINE